MEKILGKIEEIVINFKKAGTRGYQKSTLLIKLEELDLLKKEFIDFIETKVITDDLKGSTEKFDKYYI